MRSNSIENELLIDSVFVTVKNYGTTTLEEVTVNVRFPNGGFICYVSQMKSKYFNNLNLAPGDSATLYFGDIWAYYTFPTSTVELCFWTYSPEKRTDKNHENDEHCRTYIISGTGETDVKTSIQIFPNPAAEVLNLQAQTPFSDNSELHIVNAIGQVVKKSKLPGGDIELEINIADLQKGMYWLRLQNGDRVFISKFIKQ